MKTDSAWLRPHRASLVLLLRCAADLLASSRVSPGGSVAAAQLSLGLSAGLQLVGYRLMKHAASVWKNIDLANEDNVRYLSADRITDVHVWAALFAAQRVEEGSWP